jgi:hypothetical protein
MISPFLELGLGIIQRRIQLGMQWCHRIGAELETRVAILFVVTMVSVLSLSDAVTFYISYVISPFLEHDLGIIQRRIQLGMQWCYPISAELKTRVAIRYFVTMVSVLFSFCRRHFLQFVFDLTASRAWLRHQSTQNLTRKMVMPLDGSRSENSCRNWFFCDNGKSYCLCWCRHFFFFRRLLTNSTSCLIHQSTRNSMPIAAIVWDWRNSWRSFRKAILGEEVSCFLAMIAFPFTCRICMTSNRLYQIV